METPVPEKLNTERISAKKLDITLTPSFEPLQSQPSPAELKRKRETQNQHATPFILRNIKTPETPYGAFLGNKDPPKEVRKFWKLQYDELSRFEMTAEQREEQAAKKQRITKYCKDRQDEREKSKLEKEYVDYFKKALDPERTREMHVKTFEKHGVPILEQDGKTLDGKSFDDLMEEKMQKQGLSWKWPKTRKLDHVDEDVSSNETLTANLAKFDELAKLNESKVLNDTNISLSTTEGNNKSTTNRRSSMRMTLSSIEAEPERSTNFGLECEKDEVFVSKTQAPESDSQIRWVDPQEEEERKKLAARLACESQDVSISRKKGKQQTFDTMDLPENLTEELDCEDPSKNPTIIAEETKLDAEDSDKENNDFTDNSIARKSSFQLFMTSGVSAEEQHEFGLFLESIGVQLAVSTTCEPNATHVIAQKIARSEKMLGSIASGKWLLHPSYMTDCMEAGKLLPENSYEWGSEENDLINELKSELEVKLAKASHRLRVKREKGLDSVFSGIKAIIHTSAQRKSSFRQLLQIGGGKVIDESQNVKPPYSDPKDATHCIAEPNKLPKQSIDYKALAMRGVAVVNPVYINEFLANDPPPNVENHLIEDFKPYWERNKKTS